MRHVWEVLTWCDRLGAPDWVKKVAFVHDIDKLERYMLDPEPATAKQINYAAQLGIVYTKEDGKSSLSCKIDNAKGGTREISYYVYRKGIPSMDESANVVRICAELGWVMDVRDISLVSCHHGGWSAAGNREMSAEATLLHCADLLSAKGATL